MCVLKWQKLRKFHFRKSLKAKREKSRKTFQKQFIFILFPFLLNLFLILVFLLFPFLFPYHFLNYYQYCTGFHTVSNYEGIYYIPLNSKFTFWLLCMLKNRISYPKLPFLKLRYQKLENPLRLRFTRFVLLWSSKT